MRHLILMGIVAAMLAGCSDDEATAPGGQDSGVRIGEGADAGGGGGASDSGGQGPGDDGGGTGGGVDDGGTGVEDSGAGEDAGVVDPGPCRTALAADRARKVVVAHPFGENAQDGTSYEVLELGSDGSLSRTNQSFDMGSGAGSPIVFTPDGEVGFAVQEGGTLGVFRFDATGDVEVLHAALDPGFYASGVTMDPAGDAVWVWETGFRNVGGALYRIPIDCDDDTLGTVELIGASKLLRGLLFVDESLAAMVATDLFDSTAPNVLHLADLGTPAATQRLASVALFPDDGVIPEGFALTANRRHALIGDTSVFSGVPNSLAVASLDTSTTPPTLAPAQRIEMADPAAIVTSPFDDVALVLRFTEDTITVLDYAPNDAQPFSVRGPLATSPQTLLPSVATMVERGSLTGLVLISENEGIRRVRFLGGGEVEDLGLLRFDGGIPEIVGSIGVQP